MANEDELEDPWHVVGNENKREVVHFDGNWLPHLFGGSHKTYLSGNERTLKFLQFVKV
jgi:hypothetical protein